MRKNKTVKTTLELLSEQSRNAINLVLDTIESLKNTNKAIDEEKAMNDAVIADCQANNRSLDELKSGNEKIIGNFENLLK